MPEIWLNYGITDVVLDIKAENLEQKIDSEGKILDDSAINEKLNTLDLSKPMELVVLHNSKSILKIISSLFTVCEQKSKPFPKILTDKKILNLVKSGLPEGSSINEFDDMGISNSNLVFMGEMEFNGLFGYETISTRLIKKFGQESMLSAYAKRQGNCLYVAHYYRWFDLPWFSGLGMEDIYRWQLWSRSITRWKNCPVC
mgnify:CR=1 FL=1